jgi:hypothetical protein
MTISAPPSTSRTGERTSPITSSAIPAAIRLNVAPTR